MYKVFGYCNLHHSPSLGPLTEERTVASTNFLGRYAFIDFTLSNFCNSSIDEVGILLKEHPRSMIKHLGFSNSWNINTKLGANALMYNEKYINNSRYNTDINNIIENDWLFEKSHADYVVVAPAHFVMTIDYREVIKEHIKNNADITVIYKHIGNGRSHCFNLDKLVVENGLVKSIKTNKGTQNEVDISLESYVFTRSKFEKIIKNAKTVSSIYSLRDMIAYLCKTEKVHAYSFDGFVRCYDSLEHYLQYSLELLDYNERHKLFIDNWPIYTVTHDTPPTKYGVNAKVRNSFIANGAIIDGTVEGSIISRRVVISKGAKVINSIIMTDSFIGENVCIENAVIDKNVKVIQAKDLKATKDKPIYIKQGDVI